jgi:chemotaxis protein CheC
LSSAGESSVVVATQMLGDVSGTLLFVMPFSRAHELSAVLRGARLTEEEHDFDQDSETCLSETGNILASAYAGALGAMLNGVVMLSVPSFRIALAQNILERFRARAGASPFAVCLETTFNVGIDDSSYSGHMVLLPTSQTLESIAKALRARAWRGSDN